MTDAIQAPDPGAQEPRSGFPREPKDGRRHPIKRPDDGRLGPARARERAIASLLPPAAFGMASRKPSVAQVALCETALDIQAAMAALREQVATRALRRGKADLTVANLRLLKLGSQLASVLAQLKDTR